MFRKPSPKQRDRLASKLEAMKKGRERAAMAREPRGRMPELPDLRRELIVSNRIKWVQLTLGIKVCDRSCIARLKQAKVSLSSFGHDLRDPLLVAGAPSNTQHAALAIGPRSFYVLCILRSRCFTQIAKPVIGSVAVNVVNDVLWPHAMHVKPREAMRPIQPLVNIDFYVASASADAARLPTNKVSPKARFQPNEHPGVRAIVQNVSQASGGKIGLSHDAVPSQIGQRSRCVGSTSRPRYFSGYHKVAADGMPWKERVGWSKVLAGVRKSFQRLPGQRSDFWW